MFKYVYALAMSVVVGLSGLFWYDVVSAQSSPPPDLVAGTTMCVSWTQPNSPVPITGYHIDRSQPTDNGATMWVRETTNPLASSVRRQCYTAGTSILGVRCIRAQAITAGTNDTYSEFSNEICWNVVRPAQRATAPVLTRS